MMSTDGRMKQSFSLARGVSIHPIRFVRARSRRDARAYHFCRPLRATRASE